MKTEASQFEIAHGYLKVIANARGRALTVQRGSVWVAEHGSSDYVCLEAGQSLRIATDGLTVVTAFGHSSFACVTLEPHTGGIESLQQRVRKLGRSLIASFTSRGAHAAR
jgi:hypothetical protein